jgi:uncharacterized membrane protein YkoI
MRSAAVLLLVATTCLLAMPLAAAGPNDVKGMVDAGEILPFDPIRTRIMAETRGDFIGTEFDASTRRYRFRFLVDGNVVNVDVDARTGKRLNSRRSF